MIGIIIQARMGSTRLPGKVLKPINNITLLEFLINRLKIIKEIDNIIIATTNLEEDNLIVDLCNRKKINFFRGSENNVFERYFKCSKKFNLDTVIRITADCPFTDPSLISRMLKLFFEEKIDYIANTAPPEKSKWPDGTDIEIFSMEALEKANKFKKTKSELEHVTFIFWKNNKIRFKTTQYSNDYDWSKYRFTVDYPEDYELVLKLEEKLKQKNQFGHVDEIVSILSNDRSIYNLNSQYHFGIGWEKN